MQFLVTSPDHLVVITPTGSGKSVLYQGGAASEDNKITILITPFKALSKQAYERGADQAGTRKVYDLNGADLTRLPTAEGFLLISSADKAATVQFYE